MRKKILMFLSCQALIPATVWFVEIPSKSVDKESNREGSEDASNREDGNGNGPDGCERVLGDLLIVAVKPCVIDKALDDLEHTREKVNEK